MTKDASVAMPKTIITSTTNGLCHVLDTEKRMGLLHGANA